MLYYQKLKKKLLLFINNLKRKFTKSKTPPTSRIELSPQNLIFPHKEEEYSGALTQERKFNDEQSEEVIQEENFEKSINKKNEIIHEPQIETQKHPTKKKPYRKKTQIELGKKKEKKDVKETIKEKNEPKIIKKDLGRKTAPIRAPKKKRSNSKKRTTPKIDLTRISMPFIELNFSSFQINLVIPNQIIMLDEVVEKFHYKIELNSKKLTQTAQVSKLNTKYFKVEKIEIEIEEPLEHFKVIYPEEFKNSRYILEYFHKENEIYIFSGRYQNKAKTIELLDKDGKYNLIPKIKL
jgi:hypothetical protein